MTTHVQQNLPFQWQGGCQCSLHLLIQHWIHTPGTRYGWVDRGSVKYEVSWHFCTWSTLGIGPLTLWSWVQRPIHLATCYHIPSQSASMPNAMRVKRYCNHSRYASFESPSRHNAINVKHNAYITKKCLIKPHSTQNTLNLKQSNNSKF